MYVYIYIYVYTHVTRYEIIFVSPGPGRRKCCLGDWGCHESPLMQTTAMVRPLLMNDFTIA